MISLKRYRLVCSDIGIDMQDKHVSHIIARANGGADHFDNYIPFPKYLNLQFGNRMDHLMCFLVGEEQAEKAIVVSRQLGNRKYGTYTGAVSTSMFYDGFVKFCTTWDPYLTEILDEIKQIQQKLRNFNRNSRYYVNEYFDSEEWELQQTLEMYDVMGDYLTTNLTFEQQLQEIIRLSLEHKKKQDQILNDEAIARAIQAN